MGTNDHIPSKQQRTSRRKRGQVRELLHWGATELELLAPFIVQMSLSGGYVGLGRNSTGDCLLLYVKLDDWRERIAIEDVAVLGDIVSDLLDELGS